MAQTLLGNGNVTASRVVRGDTVRAASLAKYEIGTTTKTSDLSQELAAKRDRTDNTCHQTTSGFTPWRATLPSGYDFGDTQPTFDSTTSKWKWYVEGTGVAVDAESGTSTEDATSATFTFNDSGTVTFDAVRSSQPATADETFVTADYADKKVGSFSSVGGVTPTVTSGVANLSSLFSSDNTSNNLDNIRTSASVATSAATLIASKEPAFTAGTGLEKGTTPTVYCYEAENSATPTLVYAASVPTTTGDTVQTYTDTALTTASRILTYNPAATATMGGPYVNTTDFVAYNRKASGDIAGSPLLSVDEDILPYGYAGSSIAWGGTATDGAVNRMAQVTANVAIYAPKPSDGKTGDFILRFSVSASAEPTVTVNPPTGCSFGSTQYAISGDTIGTSGEYEMMIQLIPTATANTYDYIECIRKISA